MNAIDREDDLYDQSGFTSRESSSREIPSAKDIHHEEPLLDDSLLKQMYGLSVSTEYNTNPVPYTGRNMPAMPANYTASTTQQRPSASGNYSTPLSYSGQMYPPAVETCGGGAPLLRQPQQQQHHKQMSHNQPPPPPFLPPPPPNSTAGSFSRGNSLSSSMFIQIDSPPSRMWKSSGLDQQQQFNASAVDGSLPQQQQQQQIQNMLAMGQAQYVMIPGVGLALVPIMQVPSPSGSGMNANMLPQMMAPNPVSGLGLSPPLPSHLGGMSGFNPYGGQSPPSPRQMYSSAMSNKNSFKNSVLTLAAMAVQSADGLVYLVQFKRSHRNFILSQSAPRGIVIGEFVIVEADRGEDIGIVVEIAPASHFSKDKHTAGHRWKGFATGQNGEIRKVTRCATVDERALLRDKAAEEAAIAEACREKAEYQFQMPITIVDTEFQVDRHKLTIYYETQRRVDFRELVRELFSQYKTRIWMAQIDASFEPNFEASMSLLTGNYPSFAKFDMNDLNRVYDIEAYINSSSPSAANAVHPRLFSSTNIADGGNMDRGNVLLQQQHQQPSFYSPWAFDQDQGY